MRPKASQDPVSHRFVQPPAGRHSAGEREGERKREREREREIEEEREGGGGRGGREIGRVGGVAAPSTPPPAATGLPQAQINTVQKHGHGHGRRLAQVARKLYRSTADAGIRMWRRCRSYYSTAVT